MRFNPFNPQLPARPSIFVGRDPEILEFERCLSQTMHGSSMNMSISGDRGMGKTSLLEKCEQVAKENQCLVLRLSNYEGNVDNILDLADYISVNLKREILANKLLGTNIERLKQYAAAIKPTFGAGEFSLTLEMKQVVQEMLRDRLMRMWQEIKDDYHACVIMIDEAESIERIDGALIFLREVFQRVEQESNYMVVLAGKLSFPEKMSESFSPLNRFFPCHVLMPFESEEVERFVTRQCGSVSVTVSEEALDFLVKKSEGHPYVLVAMAFIVFESLKEKERSITRETVLRSEVMIYARLARDFFSPMHHPLTPKAKIVIGSISKNVAERGGKDFTFSEAVKWTGLRPNHLSPYVLELMRKGIVNKKERGRYQVFHVLFVDFVNGHT